LTTAVLLACVVPKMPVGKKRSSVAVPALAVIPAVSAASAVKVLSISNR
jgi:hypothetical protein